MKDILEKLSARIDLEEGEAYNAMMSIMYGQYTSAQIAGFLMGLKMKGESIGEISAFVRAMRDKATRVKGPEGSIDTCGTGGDGASTFNVSTAAAIVAAAAGARVAKHGNKSVSSKCGSADVFQEMGVKIDMSSTQAEKCLNETGLVFLFAPVYHPSMKHAVPTRKEMGIRTVFNILGPMSNPAMVKRQVIGAFNRDVAEKMVQVLQKTGSEHVMALHSNDGLDEFSISDSTTVFELKNGEISKTTINPEDYGIKLQSHKTIHGGDAPENAKIIHTLLKGQKSPQVDITALNAGAAIYVAGLADSMKQGVEMAFDTIYSGQAAQKINDLINFSKSLS